MRKILLNTSIAFLLISGLTTISSCNKNTNEECENWEYQDVCTPKIVSANCNEYVNKVANICGAELGDAHEGRTSLLYQNDSVKIYRHYVKQVN